MKESPTAVPENIKEGLPSTLAEPALIKKVGMLITAASQSPNQPSNPSPELASKTINWEITPHNFWQVLASSEVHESENIRLLVTQEALETEPDLPPALEVLFHMGRPIRVEAQGSIRQLSPAAIARRKPLVSFEERWNAAVVIPSAESLEAAGLGPAETNLIFYSCLGLSAAALERYFNIDHTALSKRLSRMAKQKLAIPFKEKEDVILGYKLAEITSSSPPVQPPFQYLTPKESRILQAIIEGRELSHIARTLGMGQRNLSRDVARLRYLFGAGNSIQFGLQVHRYDLKKIPLQEAKEKVVNQLLVTVNGVLPNLPTLLELISEGKEVRVTSTISPATMGTAEPLNNVPMDSRAPHQPSVVRAVDQSALEWRLGIPIPPILVKIHAKASDSDDPGINLANLHLYALGLAPKNVSDVELDKRQALGIGNNFQLGMHIADVGKIKGDKNDLKSIGLTDTDLKILEYLAAGGRREEMAQALATRPEDLVELMQRLRVVNEVMLGIQAQRFDLVTVITPQFDPAKIPAIRAWASQVGFNVGKSGKMPQAILKAYARSHPA